MFSLLFMLLDVQYIKDIKKKKENICFSFHFFAVVLDAT
jgi:hypothetical protein